jgi:hypothetical protein
MPARIFRTSLPTRIIAQEPLDLFRKRGSIAAGESGAAAVRYSLPQSAMIARHYWCPTSECLNRAHSEHFQLSSRHYEHVRGVVQPHEPFIRYDSKVEAAGSADPVAPHDRHCRIVSIKLFEWANQH